ncbi:acyltransferase [Luteibacter aegosomatis]|uniref:acyltransferase family protein n=1 Tax=Luteibacter aegosomatis TaxID=2911537 RepID=UPI001FFB1A88|nr:acyltransferase family protein [Luteibacter aegosomatis]UPG86514.1 acyltransferase [Luteibacter aegosomatis]
MRAIAVIAVIVFHLERDWLPGGFSGVDAFFVISGFVVSASVHGRGDEPFGKFFLWFLWRRCLRIVPMLALVLVATSLASTLLIPDAWLSDGIHRTGMAATFGWANVSLAGRTDSYFSPTTDFNPFAHAWSLGVEEQFYILFPFVLWPWISRKASRGVFLSALALATVCSFVLAWREGSKDGASAFYLLECRAWELLAGILLFHSLDMTQRLASRRTCPACGTWLASSGFLLVGYGLWASTPDHFPAPGALPVVMGTCLLLAAGCVPSEASWPMRLLMFRPVRWIGRTSYSLYLWHWPVFVLFRWTIGLEDFVDRVLAVVVTVVVASLCWLYVEQPIRRFSKGYAGSHAKLVAWSFVALVGAGLFQGLLHHYRWSISLSTVASHASDWYPTIKGHHASGPCASPRPSVATLGEGRRITYVGGTCDLSADESTVFVVGDSHALAFGRMFRAYAARSGRKVVVYDNAGCGYLTLQPAREESAMCRSSSQRVTEAIVKSIRPGDVVFLPSLRMPRFVDQWTRYPREAVLARAMAAEASAKDSGAVDTAIRIVSRFTEKGATVVFEAPNLLLNAPAYRCADPWTRSNPICKRGVGMDREEFESLRRPMLRAIQHIAQAVPGTSIFDPFPWLCPERPVCTGFRDGRPLFFDADHISGFGNDILLPGFEDALRSGRIVSTRSEIANSG